MSTQFRQPGRQGDVLLLPTRAKASGPVRRDADGSHTLAHGEVTGHRHRFEEGAAVTLRQESESHADKLLLEIGGGGATLRHEEHAPIPTPPAAEFARANGLPPADGYEVRIQREYDPTVHFSRRVED